MRKDYNTENSGAPSNNKQAPMIGKPEPLTVLYSKVHPLIKQKMESVNPSEKVTFRRVIRDGCCFYRSYMFGLYEHLVNNKTAIPTLVQDIEQRITPLVTQAKYSANTVNEFIEESLDSMKKLAQEDSTIETVEELFNDQSAANFIVVFARILVGSHMKCNADLYEPFLVNHSSIEEYCRKEVDPMWAEAEQLQITALASILNVPVEIVYFDRSAGAEPARHYFPEEGTPWMQLLYMPGHYDILYGV